MVTWTLVVGRKTNRARPCDVCRAFQPGFKTNGNPNSKQTKKIGNRSNSGIKVTGTHNEIRCPKCDSSIFVTAEQAGDKISCPRCQNAILVPGNKPAAKNDVTVDDLIDIDDDIMNPTPKSSESDGSEIVAKMIDEPSVDEAIAVTPDAVELPSDLQLAPDVPDLEPSTTPPPEPKSIDKPSDSNDDLGDLIDIPVTQPIKEDEDPFEVDPDADLVVDGVTPSDGQFGVDCHLCGSLLYARVSQVGTEIKCHDCYSLVKVPKPKTKPQPIETPVQEKEESSGYTLSDPYELEAVDTSIDISLGKIDYDDDEFFEKKRQLEGRAPAATDQSKDDIVSVEEDIVSIEDAIAGEDAMSSDDDDGLQLQDDPDEVAEIKKPSAFDRIDNRVKPAASDADDDDDDYNLLPIPDKLRDAKPQGNFGSSTNISNPVSIEPEEPASAKKTAKPKQARSKKANDHRDVAAKVVPESTTDGGDEENDSAKPEKRTSKTESGLDVDSVFGGLGTWFSNATQPVHGTMGLTRWALVTLFVGSCYFVMAYGSGLMRGDGDVNFQKFGGFLLVALGGLPLTVMLFFLGVVCNSIVRVAIEDRGSYTEWPEFTMADWLSQFIYVATSFWLAAIPGAIFGSLMMLFTTEPIWLYCIIPISSFVLAPFFLCSVIYNESPFALITADVFKTLGVMRNRWIRFLIFAFIASAMTAVLIYLIPFSIACFIVAGIQILLLMMYWWTLGDLTGHVVRWLVDQAE